MGYLDLVKAVEARLNERSGSAPRGAAAPSVPTAIRAESVAAASGFLVGVSFQLFSQA